MGKDFYDVLGLTASASVSDINAAYRKLALQYHPDQSGNSANTGGGPKAVAAAADKFREVAEAFDVLSNPERRATFDQFGEEGLLKGVPVDVEGKKPGFSDGYVFHDDPDKIFTQFFGSDNPFKNLFPNVDENGLVVTGIIDGERTRKMRDDDIVRDLRITLDEAFLGCVKKMKISRRVLSEDGHTTSIRNKILSVNIQKGWREGTQVKFPKEGDQGPNNIPANVIFSIRYKEHPLYTRVGDDLEHVAKIKLVEALTGAVVDLDTLDGRHLRIPVNDIVKPGYFKRVPGEGMPHQDNPKKRGDLIIRFDVEFPSSLTEDRQDLVKQALIH